MVSRFVLLIEKHEMLEVQNSDGRDRDIGLFKCIRSISNLCCVMHSARRAIDLCKRMKSKTIGQVVLRNVLIIASCYVYYKIFCSLHSAFTTRLSDVLPDLEKNVNVRRKRRRDDTFSCTRNQNIIGFAFRGRRFHTYSQTK